MSTHSNPIRIGFVGVGQIAKNHLKSYDTIDGANIVAAADLDADELARVAELHKIPDTFSDFREMLKRDDIDAVDVCLHNNLHAPVTIAALEAGKDVYCEKPIAGSLADGQAMLDAAKATGRKLHIQLGTLYSQESKAARKLIADGKLGQIYHSKSSGYRRRGRPFVDGYGTDNFVKKEIAAGGALYDMGVYHISQMLDLIGAPEIERISGKIYQETGMDEGRRQSSGYNVEELGLGLVRFGNATTMEVIEAWAAHMNPFEGSYIMGSVGGVRLDPFSYFNTTSDMPMNATFEIGSADTRWHSLDPLESAYDSSQHHWIAALQGQVELLPTADIALKTMLISEGIYLSDKLSREVTADEVRDASVSTAIKL